MLTHQTMGPTGAGRYYVTYCTPGCNVQTVACDCRTADQAAGEARRLNEQQRTRELTIQGERKARGLAGVHSGLAAEP